MAMIDQRAHLTDQVMELGRHWANAERAGDADALEPLLADDFLLVGPLGFMLDKTQYLGSRRSGDLRHKSLDWEGVRHQRGFLRFVRGLYALRREHAVLRGADWFAARGPGSVAWHNATGHGPDWDHGGPELSMHLRGERSVDFLLLVNGGPHARAFHFRPAPAGRKWRLIVDTAASTPADWTALAKARPLVDQRSRALEPRSLLLLASR